MTPKVGVFGDRLNKEKKGVFQWGQEKNRGSFGEDYENEGVFYF